MFEKDKTKRFSYVHQSLLKKWREKKVIAAAFEQRYGDIWTYVTMTNT